MEDSSLSANLPQHIAVLPEEEVPLSEMKPHPENPYDHPVDEIEHIRASLRNNGVYQNVVLASDGTILAGHGVTTAASLEGMTSFPARRTPYSPDDPHAIAILIGDNETPRGAIRDDRKITEMLKRVRDFDPNLLVGTGYDDSTLAALAMVTRPSSELADMDEAAHWVGMPEYHAEGDQAHSTLVVHFPDAGCRKEFTDKLDLALSEEAKYTWFPPRKPKDLRNVRFEA